MIKDLLDMFLGIRLYSSENHMGHNATIRVLDKEGDEGQSLAEFCISFDHGAPRFMWLEGGLSPSEREYVELKALMEVERFIDESLEA